jgi:hypothetical protein
VVGQFISGSFLGTGVALMAMLLFLSALRSGTVSIRIYTGGATFLVTVQREELI